MKSFRVLAPLLILLLVLAQAVTSQSVTGQITGSVVDPAGGMIIGAKVELTHDLTKQLRKFVTDSSGGFVFIGLVPGSYSLRIAQTGSPLSG